MMMIPLHAIIPCTLLLLLFIIPAPSHAQTDEKPCIINASFNLYPVHYHGHKRQNPDNTFYPGDAFHYLFAFSGSETCQNFRPHLIESQGGLRLLSHDVFLHGLPSQNNNTFGNLPPQNNDIFGNLPPQNNNGTSSNNPPGTALQRMLSPQHNIIEILPKNLTTAHYYRILDTQTDCTIHAGGTRTCQTTYTLSQAPVLSVREDTQMTVRQQDMVSTASPGGTSRILRDDMQIHYTHAWGFTRAVANTTHPHPANPHTLEDHASVNTIDSAVRHLCQNLGNAGCISGHVAIDTDITHTKCLIDQLQIRGVTHSLDAQDDICIDITPRISLTVHGYSIVKRHTPNGTPILVPLLVEKKVDTQIRVLPASPAVTFGHPPITDIYGYGSKNLDGTYYIDDLPAVHTIPDLAFRTVRNDTITFNVTRTASPLTELFTGTCGHSRHCTITVHGPNVTATPIRATTGDRLDVDTPRTSELLGIQNFSYRVQVYNIGRIISDTAHDTSLFFAQYSPLYDAPYPYIILRTLGGTTFEKHHGLAIHYLGSNGTGAGDDDAVHGDRRSLINGHTYTVSASNPYHAYSLNSTLALQGGQDITDIVSSVHDSVLRASGRAQLGSSYERTLISINETAMFAGQGYGRLDFVYDGLSSEAAAHNISNVTVQNTVLSSDFGGYGTKRLMSYTYAYPVSYVSSALNVTAIDSYGMIDERTSIDASLLVLHSADTEMTVPLPAHMASYIVAKTQSVPYAEMYLGDMHDIANTATGAGTAVSVVNLPAIRVLPALWGVLQIGDNNDNDNLPSIGEHYSLSSPVAYQLKITTQNASSTVDYHTYGFGNTINYTINTGALNVLEYLRYASWVRIVPPENFGEIAEITVNGIPYETPCKRRCIIFVEGDATVRADNVWGGTATANVVRQEQSVPATAQGQYEMVVAYYEGVAPYIILISLLFTAVFMYGRFLRS